MPSHRSRLFASLLMAVFAGLFVPSASALSFLPWENVRISYDTFTHSDGIQRTVGVMLPTQRSSTPTPALIALHFNQGSAASMANLSEIGEIARDAGIVVLLPMAHDLTWSHTPTELNASDDSGFLAAMIDEYVARYQLDPHRIYMTGHSQGGNMTVRFACDHPEKIAAAAVVAATMRKALGRQCKPALPTPMVFFNGTEDKQVLYDTGLNSITRDLLGIGAMGAKNAVQFWADINQCGTASNEQTLPPSVNDGTRIRVNRYTQCPPGRGVMHYTIVGGGHSWPGALDFIPVTGLTTQNLRANQAMWTFMKEFSR
ncbi:PHB depolymerase family esterase [Sinimarinibacterium sp. NLF-5-8]|uniref:alpha/beta hydrolase family esterase n=1 Tax=Sinimarinibacterium sp. NLF-5-8 TaxID=2698684 RepID=UPI00137BCC97|nr:alpha/beta fold hydrolase [Sinimarinibacterium sp. NLF-5-8]QHS11014.1 alpha/beta fold hydrolase [Sinimarinibacterium sp. NLF-5-8]